MSAPYCEACCALVDEHNDAAIGRFRDDGTELVWCDPECLQRYRSDLLRAAIDHLATAQSDERDAP